MVGAPEILAKESVKRPPLRLEANGWLKQPAREIPVVAEADIVVLGGGPAGVAAAVSAAIFHRPCLTNAPLLRLTQFHEYLRKAPFLAI